MKLLPSLLLFLLLPSLSRAAVITFQTEGGRPRILSSLPAKGSTAFPRNGEIQITFDQDMSIGTLNTTNIKLIDLSTGQVFPGWTSATLRNTSTAFRARPGVDLDTSTSYALILTPAVHSDAGTSLDPADPHHRAGTLFGEAWVIEFSTGTTISTASIRNTNIGNILGGPTGGQTNVPINAIIRVNFERAMTPASVNSTNVVLRKSGVDTPVQVNITYDDIAATAIITPVSLLQYGTTYTISLIGLQDAVGNTLP